MHARTHHYFLLQQQHQQQPQPPRFAPHVSAASVMASNGISSSSGLTNPSLNNNVFDSNAGGGPSGGGGLLSKRFNSTSLAVGPLGNLGDLSTSLNPYEKWSNGSDKLFDHHTSDSILELSSKLLTLGKWN